MASLVEMSPVLNVCSTGSKRASAHLSDQFWEVLQLESLRLDNNNTTSNNQNEHPSRGPTPNILGSGRNTPINNFNPPRRRNTPKLDIDAALQVQAADLQQQNDQSLSTGPAKSALPPTSAIHDRRTALWRSPIAPRSALPLSAIPRSAKYNPRLRKFTDRITSCARSARSPIPPTSAMLSLASSFLDSLVKVTRSRPSTPIPKTPFCGFGNFSVMESEVVVNVIEDGDAMDFGSSPVEVVCFGSPVDVSTNISVLEKLDIPPPTKLSMPLVDSAIETPYMLSGPVACAQELDALSQMNWERQLLNRRVPCRQ